ncbi:MAG: Bud site selection protein 6 [Cirrosporium novae-zelandiae]|nr:MAG: Bud site selection protein 6 [Cirrosporium novae-zelandiae]
MAHNSQKAPRRSPAAEPGPPPSYRAPSNSSVSTKMDSSGSQVASPTSRSSSSRSSRNPSQQLSQIEKSVTHLLVATKQLLETLTSWSRRQATDRQVSDVYVLLGYEFNIACRAFTAIGVDISDLGNVPEVLRTVLEDTLSQEATPQSLDHYLPRIRDIIINLLQGLKKKQTKLRNRQNSGYPATVNGHVPRQDSITSVGSGDSGLTRMLEDGTKKAEERPDEPQRQQYDRYQATSSPTEQPKVPNRSSSVHTSRRKSPPQTDQTSNASKRETQRSNQTSPSGSSLSSNTMQNIPVIAPFPDDRGSPVRESTLSGIPASFPPPPPPPKQQDALAALQRGGELERRASRRYSQYQISKHLGASPGGVPMLPPSQNSPIPNRGRDNRESLNAVRVRGSLAHIRGQSSNRLTTSMSMGNLPNRISEESVKSRDPVIRLPDDAPPDDSPTAKTPEDKYRSPALPMPVPDIPVLEATLSGPAEIPSGIADEAKGKGPEKSLPRLPSDVSITDQERPKKPSIATPTETRQFTPEGTPGPGKELTLFLQYKSKIKKFVLSEGYDELSVARLQLAFIEKFNWNTHSNGRDLPEIYIQDPISGVRHELEDLSDIKDRSVLVLNVEALDEVKSHIDEGIGGLRRMLDSVRAVVENQESTIQRVSTLQQDTAKEVAKLAATPAPATATAIATTVSRTISLPSTARSTPIILNANSASSAAQLSEIQSLRRDLAVVRQTYSNFVDEMTSSMTSIRGKASSIKTVAVQSAVPSLDPDSGRAYVNVGKKALGDDSEKIVNRVDDLQDIVEDLRKDVVTRGVRPLPRKLEVVSKDISVATAELKKMQQFLKREKPLWTKIWEKELELVCNERDFLTLQEDLAADLEDDLEKASQTFALVEQATKQQNLTAQANGDVVAPGSNFRNSSRSLPIETSLDPVKAKDDMLDEVRALQPNHESRVEAIERAERARQKELEERKEGEFKKELVGFVEGGGLKKSGGFEEVERRRKMKDDRIRKEVWERMNGIAPAPEGADGAPEEDEDPMQDEEGVMTEATGVDDEALVNGGDERRLDDGEGLDGNGI